jgi:uroporphyrinogen decarboxylase
VIDPPVRTQADVERLRVPEIESAVPFVFESIRLLRRELDGRVPLIGFGASPFTLCAYLCEGEGSRSFEHWKTMLYGRPSVAQALLEKVTHTTVAYLTAQVQAGAQVIQVFDTWAGMISRADYETFALPYVKRVIEAVRAAGVPVVYFALDAAHLAPAIDQIGADVLGCDWRTSLADASRALGGKHPLQGNLDPCALLGDVATVRRRTEAMLQDGSLAPGHIANLGHGILPNTPVENAMAFVETVKSFVAKP